MLIALSHGRSVTIDDATGARMLAHHALRVALARARRAHDRAAARSADRVALSAWRLSPRDRERIVAQRERARDAGITTHAARRAQP